MWGGPLNDESRQMRALVEFYLHLDTDTMDDDTLARKWQQLKWTLNYINPRPEN